jgi:IMP dehydrogenase/GMP reductase
MLLIKQYLWYAVAAAFLAIGLLAGVQTVRVNSLQGKLLAEQKQSAVQLAKVHEQDAMIQQYIAESQAATARVKAAEAKAARDRVVSQARIAELAAQKMPEEVVARTAYIVKEFQKLNADWEAGK